MYVCLCNPFTDRDVKEHLETLCDCARVKDVYTACSGGEAMNCGSCACALKQMVDHHNNTRSINTISINLKKAVYNLEDAV